jgi:tetratricopeptide (TPR) repeat protein
VRKKISAAGVILSFLCLLWVDVFPQAGSQAQSEFQKALEAGKKLYESGDHEKAIIKLFEAQNLAREKRDLAEACFHISLCYYALSESENCVAYLRRAFEAYPEKDIDERLFPPRFVGLFYQTKRDVLKAAPAKPEVKTEEKKIESEKKAEPEKKTETEKKDEKKTEPAKKIEPPKIEEKKKPEKKVEKKPEEKKPPAAAGRGKQEIPAGIFLGSADDAAVRIFENARRAQYPASSAYRIFQITRLARLLFQYAGNIRRSDHFAARRLCTARSLEQSDLYA